MANPVDRGNGIAVFVYFKGLGRPCLSSFVRGLPIFVSADYAAEVRWDLTSTSAPVIRPRPVLRNPI